MNRGIAKFKVFKAYDIFNFFTFVRSMEVVYIGMQETGFPEIPDFPLYNLTKDIPGHPTHSTLCREELEKAGYMFPYGAP